jgi:hypothetical protein
MSTCCQATYDRMFTVQETIMVLCSYVIKFNSEDERKSEPGQQEDKP